MVLLIFLRTLRHLLHARRYRRLVGPVRSRPHDPREHKYALAFDPAAVAPASMARFRSQVENQGQIGSCVANAVTSAIEAAHLAAGSAIVQLNRLWLYAKCRMREGTFPQDAGSVPADACDIARTIGVPREDLWPYRADATLVPPAALDQDAANQRWLASHAPIYGGSGQGYAAGISQALAQNFPVVLAMYWHSDFFSVLGRNGVLPVRDQHSAVAPDRPAWQRLLHRLLIGARGIVGGHAIWAWAVQVLATSVMLPDGSVLPAGTILVWCRNSWGQQWTDASVQRVNPEAEPGDFALPLALFDNGMVMEARAITPVAVPSPPPAPTPTLTGLSPSTSVAGSADVTLTASGSGLTAATTLLFSGAPLVTGTWSTAKVVATIPGRLLQSAGSYAVEAQTGPQVSNTLTYTVTAPPPPPPPPPAAGCTIHRWDQRADGGFTEAATVRAALDDAYVFTPPPDWAGVSWLRVQDGAGAWVTPWMLFQRTTFTRATAPRPAAVPR